MAWIVAGNALAVVLTSCAVRAPFRKQHFPPLCQQITDHVNAYLVYMGCPQARFGGVMGHAPAVAARIPAGETDCTVSNEVSELRYRSPRVDDAAYETMQNYTSGGLTLEDAVASIWLGSLEPRLDLRGEQWEVERLRMQAELRESFWRVPSLYIPLRNQIAARLGEPDACPQELAAPVVDVSGLPAALEAMKSGTERTDGSHDYGLLALGRRRGEQVDPNIAVAIRRASAGGWASTPDYAAVLAELREMGVQVDGATAEAGNVPPACASRTSTTLPGVRIEFVTETCSWTLEEAAAGLGIDYVVVVERDIDGVQPMPQDEGECDGPGPSGLILFEELRGNGQRYCLCDKGLCPGDPRERITLRKGRYPGTFRWDGRNWAGASDTDALKGDPFLAGRYTLVVSAVGHWRDGERDVTFQVIGSFELTLVEGGRPADSV